MVWKQYNKWVASWQQNKIQKSKSFDNEQEAIKFENEKRALNKLQRKQQRQSKTKEQRRAEGLLKSGGNNECESEAIRQLVRLLEKFLSVRPVANGRDGRPDIKKQ